MVDENLNLLSAKELATMLAVSVRTVWRLRSAGKLPKPIMIGASCRWKVSDIDGWLSVNCDMNRFKGVAG